MVEEAGHLRDPRVEEEEGLPHPLEDQEQGVERGLPLAVPLEVVEWAD